MKKLAIVCITLLGSALLVLGTAPSASAYPDQTCQVEVDRQHIHPGETFTATGTVAGSDGGSAAQVHWTFEWNGKTVHRTGSRVSATFRAPQVSTSRTIRLTARADTASGPCVHHIDITVSAVAVSPPSTNGGGGGGDAGDGGLLPNTGGPTFWLLLAALALLLVGGGTALAARRRD